MAILRLDVLIKIVLTKKCVCIGLRVFVGMFMCAWLYAGWRTAVIANENQELVHSNFFWNSSKIFEEIIRKKWSKKQLVSLDNPYDAGNNGRSIFIKG